MANFTFNLDGLAISINGNSNDEIAETLLRNGYGNLLHDHFYFSKSTQQRTGQGWIRLEDMNEVFIVNSFVARLSDVIKQVYKNDRVVDNGPYGDAFISLFYDLLAVAEVYSDKGDVNPVILQGLINELSRRDSASNNGFDNEPEDDVVSNDGPVPEPFYVRLSASGNLAALDKQ